MKKIFMAIALCLIAVLNCYGNENTYSIVSVLKNEFINNNNGSYSIGTDDYEDHTASAIILPSFWIDDVSFSMRQINYFFKHYSDITLVLAFEYDAEKNYYYEVFAYETYLIYVLYHPSDNNILLVVSEHQI